MKIELKNQIAIFLLLLMCSCKTSNSTVNVQPNSRKQLSEMEFKGTFITSLEHKKLQSHIYSQSFENKKINYFAVTYIRFFDTGQYACFLKTAKNQNLNNLSAATFVGYYRIKNNLLELETPMENVEHYEKIWKFRIADNKLYSLSRNLDTFVARTDVEINEEFKPDW